MLTNLPTDLHHLLTEVFAVLKESATRPGSPLHWPVVASHEGIRMVVLRGFDAAERSLLFTTDARSSKVGELQANDSLRWLFYDPAQRMQLRIRSRTTLHKGDELAARLWAGLTPQSRLAYCTTQAPGSSAASSTDGLSAAPNPDQGWDNFMVVRAEFDTVDCLTLTPSQRARFTWVNNSWQGQWLVP